MSEDAGRYLTRRDLFPINCHDSGLTLDDDSGMVSGELSETPMKTELKLSGNRHARKLIKKLSEIIDLPFVAQDSIRQECEYATMDGYRLTMKYQSEKEIGHEQEDDQDRFNR